MDIEQKLIESRREVCDEIERALRDALARALGASCPTLLQTAIEHKSRLACLQTSAATWYYVDEQCIYGYGPLETIWTEDACTVRQEVLDPADAPHPYARTTKASFQPDGSTKLGDVPAKDPNMPDLLLSSTSGKFDGASDYLESSVEIPAFAGWPDFTIDWRQDLQGRITDVRFTKGVARYKTPWWRKLLLRLLPGSEWTYVRFHLQKLTRLTGP